MNAKTWFYSQPGFHQFPSEPRPEPKQPETIEVDRWDAAQRKWVTVEVPNPLFKREEDDEPLPTVRCGICGTEHTVPECKFSEAPTDPDVSF